MCILFGLFIIPQGGDETDLVDFSEKALLSLRSRWGLGGGKGKRVGGEEGKGSGIGM